MNDDPLPDPQDISELFDSRFVHAADLKGANRALKIERITREIAQDDNNQDKVLGSLHFEGKKKCLGMNKTNALTIAAMFGPKCQGWKGKTIVLMPTTCRMPDPASPKGQRKMITVDCIRVFGSPDLPADLTFTLKLPRRKPLAVTLKRTDAKGAPIAAVPGATPITKPDQTEPPPSDDDPFGAEGAT